MKYFSSWNYHLSLLTISVSIVQASDSTFSTAQALLYEVQAAVVWSPEMTCSRCVTVFQVLYTIAHCFLQFASFLQDLCHFLYKFHLATPLSHIPFSTPRLLFSSDSRRSSRLFHGSYAWLPSILVFNIKYIKSCNESNFFKQSVQIV